MPSKIMQGIQTRIQKHKERKAAQKGKLKQTEVTSSAPLPEASVKSQLDPSALANQRHIQERQTKSSPVDKPALVLTENPDEEIAPHNTLFPTYQEATGQPSQPNPSKPNINDTHPPVEGELDTPETPDNPVSESVENNETETEHHSRLGSIIKPFITVNKAQVQAAKEHFSITKTELKQAQTHLANLSKSVKTLQKKLRQASKGKRFESSLKKAATESKGITEDLLKSRHDLQKATAQVQLLQQSFVDAEKELKEAEKNTDNLVNFATSLVTSLRTLYKLSQSSTPDHATIDRKRTIHVPQLVIDTPDGRMQIDDLKLKLRVLNFEQKGKGWAPVLGVESMTGKISMPLPDQQALKLDLNLKDVNIEMQAGFGSPLHSYVTSKFALTGAAKALGQLTRNSQKLMPEFVSVKGQKVVARLDDCSVKTFSALAHKGESSPESDADKLFEALGFNVRVKLDELEVSTRGDINLSASAQRVAINYVSDPNRKKQSSKMIHRQASLSADYGKVTVKKGLSFVQDLAAELKTSDPLALIPGLTKSSKQASSDQLAGLSESLTLEGFKPKLSVHRELKSQVTKKWKGVRKKRQWALTGSNHLKGDIDQLKVVNHGGLNGTGDLHGITFEAKPPSNTPGTMTAKAKSGSVNVTAPTGLLPKTIKEQELELSGKATITLVKPELSSEFSANAQSLTMRVPTLSTKVEQTIDFRLGDNSIRLPKGISLEAHGKVEVKQNELGATVTPQLSLHGNDKIFVKAGKVRKNINLKGELTLQEATHHIMMHTDQATGNTVTTPVITEGTISLKAPALGPVKLEKMELRLDGKGNGSVGVSGLIFDLDSASSNDRVDSNISDIEGSNEGGEVHIQETPLPKPLRWLLKRKNLHLDVSFSVQKGQLNLKGLRKIKPKFTTQPGAGFGDKVMTLMLNAVVTVARRQLQKYSLDMLRKPQMINNKVQMVDIPCVNFSFGPVKKTIPLPLPPAYIDPLTDTVPLGKVLHETSGVVLTTRDHLKRAKQILTDIKGEQIDGIAQLSQMCHDLSHNPNDIATLSMLAQQLPLEHIQAIFTKHPKQQSILTQQLDSCGEAFIKHPHLQHPALQIFQITGHKTSAALHSEMQAQMEADKSVDPTALAMFMEQHKNTKQAAQYYKLALERKKSMPLAHTRLGIIQLKEQIASGSVDSTAVNKAMGHLLHGAMGGFTQAEIHLKTAETHSNPAISDKAKLYNATLSLVRESAPLPDTDKLLEFKAAMSRLEHLAQHSTDPKVRDSALKQMRNRQLNSKHIFHNQDEKTFEKSRKEHANYMKSVWGKEKSHRKKEALNLGMKLCYGSEGTPVMLDHGKQLLQIAANDGFKQASIHLEAIAAKA